jgi:AbiV family abortive infection protein
MTQTSVEPAPQAVAAQAILANVLRLYADALLLLNNDRFASCLSISILAAEELAKFLSLIEMQRLKQGDWHKHQAKHIGTASFLLRRKYQAALTKVLDGRVEKADHARLKQVEFRESEMSLFDEVMAHVISDGSLKYFADAFSKETDKQKQRGFYVDLGDDLSIRSTPLAITKELARTQFELVKNAIRALRTAFDDPTE